MKETLSLLLSLGIIILTTLIAWYISLIFGLSNVYLYIGTGIGGVVGIIVGLFVFDKYSL